MTEGEDNGGLKVLFCEEIWLVKKRLRVVILDVVDSTETAGIVDALTITEETEFEDISC
jgi:hypothetical protein